MNIQKLACPSCGAAITDEGTNTLNCAFCGSLLTLQADEARLLNKDRQAAGVLDSQSGSRADAASLKTWRWYDNRFMVIFALLFFLPVGLYGLWKSGKFSSNTKWILVSVVLTLMIIGFINDKKQGLPKPPSPLLLNPSKI
jgi:predicted RNA-binding Zn-ribbon protein involved in translation (DUF1610 family)